MRSDEAIAVFADASLSEDPATTSTLASNAVNALYQDLVIGNNKSKLEARLTQIFWVLFHGLPDLQAIFINGYTPAFNDGDPCCHTQTVVPIFRGREWDYEPIEYLGIDEVGDPFDFDPDYGCDFESWADAVLAYEYFGDDRMRELVASWPSGDSLLRKYEYQYTHNKEIDPNPATLVRGICNSSEVSHLVEAVIGTGYNTVVTEHDVGGASWVSCHYECGY